LKYRKWEEMPRNVRTQRKVRKREIKNVTAMEISIAGTILGIEKV
jgi:hypothetical protein